MFIKVDQGSYFVEEKQSLSIWRPSSSTKEKHIFYHKFWYLRWFSKTRALIASSLFENSMIPLDVFTFESFGGKTWERNLRKKTLEDKRETHLYLNDVQVFIITDFLNVFFSKFHRSIVVVKRFVRFLRSIHGRHLLRGKSVISRAWEVGERRRSIV